MQAVDLFAGAGGLALGAAKAGCRHIIAVEREPHATAVLKKNSRAFADANAELEILQADVRHLSRHDLDGNCDVLLAGSPCQPFSISGKWAGEHDSREGVRDAMRIAAMLTPRAIVFENVFGMALEPFREFFDDVLCILSNLATMEIEDRGASNAVIPRVGEYFVYWRVLNAADFGVPQLRRRLFIVCIRRDAQRHAFEFPSPTHSEAALLKAQFQSNVYWDRHGVTPPKIYRERMKAKAGSVAVTAVAAAARRWRTIRDVVRELPEPGARKSDIWHAHRPGARIYKGHSGSFFDWPAKTIKAGVHGVPGGENMVRLSERRVRYLTIRECAAIQSFPRGYSFSEGFSQSMRLIGNAVPAALASAVVQSVFTAIR